ncbi:hypothetical protein [Actinobacillus pleuropneumoniae]
MIGTIDLRVNQTNNIGELGYVLNRTFWGNGYGLNTQADAEDRATGK